jgi:purine-binding chemotaxis protein CheW
VCLSTVLGQFDVDFSGANVLLVDVEGGLVGFVVPTLRAIEESVWEERPAQLAKSGADLLRSGPLVKVGAGDQARMVPNIDLTQLASAIRGA